MLLDLSRVRSVRTAIDEVYPPLAFERAESSYAVIEPARLHVDIQKDGPRYWLSGGVETTLELLCARCVEPFRWPMHASFDLLYQPQSANVGEGEIEVEADDLSTAFYENDEIDLGQLMREQFYLALPMKPLCQAECRGLCPACGTNLNRGACDCRREWTDPRLVAIKALKTES